MTHSCMPAVALVIADRCERLDLYELKLGETRLGETRAVTACVVDMEKAQKALSMVRA